MLNGLSIDVEEAFHASAFERECPMEVWERLEKRNHRNIPRLLDLLDRHQVRATFFVLGWVAEFQPQLVRDIARRGHEIACHGYSHRLIYDQTPEVFRQDVAAARARLQDLSGQPVRGYRAPSYSITPRSSWAPDVLLSLGFEYDSSIFPVRHDRYGYPGMPRFPYRLRTLAGGLLQELPPTSMAVGGVNVPVAGGGYFRLYPTKVTELAVAFLNGWEQQPAFVYLHPWEVDPEQPRLTSSSLRWWRHSVNLAHTEARLEQLLQRFQFSTFESVLAGLPSLPEVGLPGRREVAHG
jgi:polysaccharide deacetylase family protein (PEP-CTERM system associated)